MPKLYYDTPTLSLTYTEKRPALAGLFYILLDNFQSLEDTCKLFHGNINLFLSVRCH